ncbi:MAG: TolC family protein [Desulfitobacteriaceae bacterium]|nr:TolC family protein [Desulfitobacteriaceae bacterium]
MKKLLAGFFVVVLLFAATVSGSVGEDSQPEAKSLSLSQAIELALKENHQIELAGIGVEKAKLAVDQAESAAKKANNQIGNEIPNAAGGTSTIRKDQNLAMVIDVLPKQAQSGKVIADTALSYTENSIKFGVEAAYYGVQQAEKLLEVSQASFKRAEEQYKQAQARFNAGTSAKMEVISAEAQLKSAEAGVNEAQSTLQVAMMNLNKTLGLNLETPLKLTDSFQFKTAEAVDVEKVIQEMTDQDISFVSAREEFNINQLNFDYHEKYYTSNTFVYRDAQYKYKEAEVKYDNAKVDLRLNIKGAYLDLKTAEENYHVLTKSLEQAKEAYRLNKLRYEVGMATNYDVLNAEAALKQAELGLLNALYNYNLAKAKFAYGIFPGSSSAGGASAPGM